MEKNVTLSMQGIIKEFSGVRALDGVDFEARSGEILALVGENGAGKSTLMKILSGVYPASSFQGKLQIFGQNCRFNKPRDAEMAGVSIIHQELMLIEDLSIAENIYMGHLENQAGIVNWKKIRSDARQAMTALNLNLNVNELIRNLGVGQKQLVEIAKALTHRSKILVLDEPTAALSDCETEILFKVLKDLRAQGLTLIYITHRMGEVFELADRVTVLRDGKHVGTLDRTLATHDRIVSMMVGREISKLYPPAGKTSGDIVLEVRNFNVYKTGASDNLLVKDASFYLKSGEVVGLSGLLGSGRSELLMAVAGAYKGRSKGEVVLFGQKRHLRNPRQAIRNGIAILTEDRKSTGLNLIGSVSNNISMASHRSISQLGIIRSSVEKNLVNAQIKDLKLKAANVNMLVSSLSGGNQQKAVLGKWLSTNPRILILDEPTRGVDIGARSEIYQIIRELANQGLGILMISSDLPEILGMSDRVYVMHEGSIVTEIPRCELNEELVMQHATGMECSIPAV